MNVQKTAMGSRGVEIIVNGTAQQNENALDILLPANLVEREYLVNNFFLVKCQIFFIFICDDERK